MINYRQVEECLDAIFDPSYERGTLRINEGNALIMFMISPQGNGWWRVLVGGFEDGEYFEPRTVQSKELLDIFEDCLHSFCYERQFRYISFNLNVVEKELDDLQPLYSRNINPEDNNIQIFKAIISKFNKACTAMSKFNEA